MTTALSDVRPIGEQLRAWRQLRRLSQLELASEADVSTRHLSFVETGRSAPSREMVLRLAEHLDVPLRDRNLLLVAAGYAPVFDETPIEEPRMDTVRAALRQVLEGHEPYPAVVVDRFWNLIDANGAAAFFMEGAPPELLEPPLNVLRLSMHPDGMARNILNLAEWRAHMIDRVRRHVALTADAALAQLYKELRSFPGDVGEAIAPPAGHEVFVPLRMRLEGRELSFFSTIATFGTPVDITVAELAIESFYPADRETADFLRERAGM
ncbi:MULTISPECIES: helix-turn-helix domain-containing protein [Actinomadura]|uniref:DNA-binding transcriptional regulator, XRE-family HTH domain n=1 Tax=Actinomadura madurae TaxID=1993 RepID=A0A1I5HIV0_9ACTN|nr:helix-turn-helix transcriptional regulator [Actinomadura madurae]URN01486.1 helix-turn-helix transcriptional regulator [Actinomadura madurae]SFO47791.1 DNA-binding transcriptional regulator, XRE-family HTH domain [Actinomadura madurae]SPT57759.1 anaerobic benzoate catabolism transcriptional regulator [Actinomadura madurae]